MTDFVALQQTALYADIVYPQSVWSTCETYVADEHRETNTLTQQGNYFYNQTFAYPLPLQLLLYYSVSQLDIDAWIEAHRHWSINPYVLSIFIWMERISEYTDRASALLKEDKPWEDGVSMQQPTKRAHLCADIFCNAVIDLGKEAPYLVADYKGLLRQYMTHVADFWRRQFATFRYIGTFAPAKVILDAKRAQHERNAACEYGVNPIIFSEGTFTNERIAAIYHQSHFSRMYTYAGENLSKYVIESKEIVQYKTECNWNYAYLAPMIEDPTRRACLLFHLNWEDPVDWTDEECAQAMDIIDVQTIHKMCHVMSIYTGPDITRMLREIKSSIRRPTVQDAITATRAFLQEQLDNDKANDLPHTRCAAWRDKQELYRNILNELELSAEKDSQTMYPNVEAIAQRIMHIDDKMDSVLDTIRTALTGDILSWIEIQKLAAYVSTPLTEILRLKEPSLEQIGSLVENRCQRRADVEGWTVTGTAKDHVYERLGVSDETYIAIKRRTFEVTRKAYNTCIVESSGGLLHPYPNGQKFSLRPYLNDVLFTRLKDEFSSPCPDDFVRAARRVQRMKYISDYAIRIAERMQGEDTWWGIEELRSLTSIEKKDVPVSVNEISTDALLKMQYFYPFIDIIFPASILWQRTRICSQTPHLFWHTVSESRWWQTFHVAPPDFVYPSEMVAILKNLLDALVIEDWLDKNKDANVNVWLLSLYIVENENRVKGSKFLEHARAFVNEGIPWPVAAAHQEYLDKNGLKHENQYMFQKGVLLGGEVVTNVLLQPGSHPVPYPVAEYKDLLTSYMTRAKDAYALNPSQEQKLLPHCAFNDCIIIIGECTHEAAAKFAREYHSNLFLYNGTTLSEYIGEKWHVQNATPAAVVRILLQAVNVDAIEVVNNMDVHSLPLGSIIADIALNATSEDSYHALLGFFKEDLGQCLSFFDIPVVLVENMPKAAPRITRSTTAVQRASHNQWDQPRPPYDSGVVTPRSQVDYEKMESNRYRNRLTMEGMEIPNEMPIALWRKYMETNVPLPWDHPLE